MAETSSFRALLGVMYMTRHVSLALIPVFLCAWLLEMIGEKRKVLEIIKQGIVMILFMTAAYMPYFIMQFRNGFKVKLILGFGIASRPNPEQLTLDRLLIVALFYLCYLSVIS